MGKFDGKVILELGTSIASVDIVKYAKSEGAYVIVTDYLPTEKSEAKQYADEVWDISTSDIEALYKKAKLAGVDAVFAGVSEFNLKNAMELCEKLDLPFYGKRKQIMLTTNKRLFKDICRENGVPVPLEYSLEDISDGNVKYPVIIKPVDSGGSRGITVCNCEAEVYPAIDKALAYSEKKKYLIEKYLSGDEIVMYYYMQDGTPYFVAMCDRYVYKGPGGAAQLPTAYIFPSRYTDEHIKRTNESFERLFKNIEINNGPVFLQGFIEDGSPVIYEPGYRLNGAREDKIVSGVMGISSMKMLVDYAFTGKMSENSIGPQVDPYFHGKFACKLSPVIRKGKIAKITGVDEVESHQSVLNVCLNNNVGNEITDNDVGTLQQIAYRAYIVEDSVEKLRETIDYVQKTIHFFDEYGQPMIEGTFDTSILLKNYKQE